MPQGGGVPGRPGVDQALVGKGELGAMRVQKSQGMRVWGACVQAQGDQRKRVQGMCVPECREAKEGADVVHVIPGRP